MDNICQFKVMSLSLDFAIKINDGTIFEGARLRY